MRIRHLIPIALLAGSSAQAAPLLWRGEVQVVAVKETTAGACHGGWFPGFFFTTIFQPAGLPGNTAANQFSLFRENSAWQFTIDSGAPPTPVASLHYVLKTGGFVAQPSHQLTGVSISPASITPTTNAVTLRFTVPDIFANVGCKASFYGVVQRTLP